MTIFIKGIVLIHEGIMWLIETQEYNNVGIIHVAEDTFSLK